MKTNVILLLVSVILLSSCAGKFSVMKRRYNKGFYVAASGDRKQGDQKNERSVSRKAGTPVKASAPVMTELKMAHSDAAIQQSKPVASAWSTGIRPETKQKQGTIKSVITARKLVRDIQPAISEAKRKQAMSHAAGDTGTNKILLIILALFPILSLIAVYLHDGGITINFWITLILHLLFLYWLFALLVVLDVIDLR